MIEREANVDVDQLNALALAFMGDSVLDMFIRRYLLERGTVRPNRLHQEATKYVSAKAQARIVHDLLEQEFFSEDEISVFKRGRNAKSSTIPKNTDVNTYRYSTGFEAVLGYHYLRGASDRLDEILTRSLAIIETTNN